MATLKSRSFSFSRSSNRKWSEIKTRGIKKWSAGGGEQDCHEQAIQTNCFLLQDGALRHWWEAMQTAGCAKQEEPLGFNCWIAAGKLNIHEQPHQAGVCSSGTENKLFPPEPTVTELLRSTGSVWFGSHSARTEFLLFLGHSNDLRSVLVTYLSLQRKISIFGPFITSIKC